MEGLTFGWKKSVKKYHYYDSDTYSLCGGSLYAKTSFKELEFLADAEITADMMICSACYSARRAQVTNQIKERVLRTVRSDIGYVVKEVTCDEKNCDAKGVALVSTTSEEKKHLCLLHNLRIHKKHREEPLH